MAEGRAQVSKILHILKRSANVAKHRWVAAKEGHGFGLVQIQRQPFQIRVAMESVELELEVLGNIGSKCMSSAYSKWETFVVCKAVIAP